MDRLELIRINRRQILAISRRYGAKNISIFGSVARDESRLDSDIDFLVELEQGRSLFDLGGLSFELQELLEVPVDVVTLKCLKPRMRDQVLLEAKPLGEDYWNSQYYYSRLF